MSMDSANAASAASQKKNSSLAWRIVSALILIPLILGLAWWSYWSVVALVLLATVVALREYAAMLEHSDYRPSTGLCVGVGLALVLGFALRPLVSTLDTLALAMTAAVVACLVYEVLRYDGSPRLASWGLQFAGAVYFSWLASHFILLRGLQTPLQPAPLGFLSIPPGAAWIVLVLAITWLQDSVAYFVGRALGRTRMTPLLSPKKTWEGAAGGLVAAVLGAVLAAWLLGLPISPLSAALIGLIGGIVGPFGDLAVSMIKRQVHTKDSGSIIPGHGGVLDRADSLIFVGAVTYYLIPLFLA